MKDLEKWGDTCKTYGLFDVLGKKWSIFIIYSIKNGYNTFNSIMRVLTKLTPKVLSTRLSQLEENNIIKFDIDKKNGRTTYVLTDKGEKIAEHILNLSNIIYDINE